MGWHLIGLAWPLASISGILSGVGTVLLVIVGLNFVILVHELGHFLVAKLCGVKCEKFYIWFDAFGFRLGRFRWGETEYGVGWLPLGGYVKMLGQEDNPARLREEIARAKVRQTAEEVPIASSEAAAIPAVQAVPADSADFASRSTLRLPNRPSTTRAATSRKAFPSAWPSFRRA